MAKTKNFRQVLQSFIILCLAYGNSKMQLTINREIKARAYEIFKCFEIDIFSDDRICWNPYLNCCPYLYVSELRIRLSDRYDCTQSNECMHSYPTRRFWMPYSCGNTHKSSWRWLAIVRALSRRPR